MYIFRTHPQNITQVVQNMKHALDRRPTLLIGDRVLISQTISDGDSHPPIRYVMTYFRILPDLHDETISIWGKKWPYIIQFDRCRKLMRPFDIRDVQVTKHNYGAGGPIVRVDPADEYAIDQLNLLS